jgi:predicted DNA binding CopG/RHH family protein
MAKAQTVEEFDRRFDAGEDIFDLAEIKAEDITRPGAGASKRINIDLPDDFLVELDKEANRRGITRQSLIKVWLYERLQSDRSITVIDPETGKIVSSSATHGQLGPASLLLAMKEELTRHWRTPVPKGSIEEGKGTLRPAVVAILEKSKKPLRSEEIYDALVEQGYQFTFKNAKHALRYRLSKMPGVQPFGKGLFKLK